MTEQQDRRPERTQATGNGQDHDNAPSTGSDGLAAWPADHHPPLNRAERRRRGNRAADAIQDNMQSQAANEAGQAPMRRDGGRGPAAANRQFDPAYGGGGDDDGSFAGRPDQGVQHDTGAGSGGATESDGRLTRHEGMHLGNRPKG